MKKQLLLLPLLLLASCGEPSSTVLPGPDTSHTDTPVVPDTSYRPDGEYVEDELGGGEVDKEEDFADNDISQLVSVLTSLSAVKKYEYRTTYNLTDIKYEACEHYGEHYYYDENITYPLQSYGLAEEVDTKQVFHFYVDENHDPKYIASVYEYMALSNEDPHPLTGLFSGLGIAGLHNFSETVLDDLTATRISTNEYYITSASAYGTFLYMTNYGSSLTDSLTGCLVTILDAEKLNIQVELTFGEEGTITSTLTPLETSEFDDLDAMIASGEMKGITSYADVATFYDDMLSNNNYTITGAMINSATEERQPISFTAKLTDNYFLIDYSDIYNEEGYDDFGYMYLPAHTEVKLADGTTSNLDYSGCYEFKIVDGVLSFTSFVGPTTSGGTEYIEVATKADLDSLPDDQLSSSYIYIVLDENAAYQYAQQSDGSMGFTYYSSWFNSVGDFPISGNASFYTSGSSFGAIAKYYFSEDWNHPNTYFTTDASVLATVASSLFGWGYVPGSTTWQNYVNKLETIINKEGDQIVSGDLRLHADQNGTDTIFLMEFRDIGTTEIPQVESVYSKLIGGQQ